MSCWGCRRRGRTDRRTVVGVSLPVLAVDEVSVLELAATQGPARSRRDRHVARIDHFEGVYRVACTGGHVHVAPHRADRAQVDVRMQDRVHQRHGVVDTGVTVNDDLRAHAFSLDVLKQ